MNKQEKEHLHVIEQKIDKIDERMDNIALTLARNTESLEIHIKRTNLLESKVEIIDKHVIMVNAIVKTGGLILGAMATLAGIVISLYKIFK